MYNNHLLLQIVGALAEEGKSLTEIVAVAKQAVNSMGEYSK
jgi:dihydroxyacetone kinase